MEKKKREEKGEDARRKEEDRESGKWKEGAEEGTEKEHFLILKGVQKGRGWFSLGSEHPVNGRIQGKTRSSLLRGDVSEFAS